ELLAAITGSSFDHIEGNHYRETVNLTNIGANGDLKISWALKDETGELDGRTVAGLWDVSEVLDQGFVGDLTYGVVLTEDAFERYLNHADDVVLFRYEGGSGNDNITIEDWDDVAGDPDFAMVADLGDGHDRLNIDIATVSSVSVDGGDGRNTIAVVNSHGTTKANTFEHFANFQTYEVEGDAATAHDFTSMAGVDTIIIATEGDTSTTLIDAEADADITVTGKNQTLEDGNSDQTFASIAVLGSEAEDLTITLENTARLDGELTLETLVVNDHNHDGDLHESAVRTLNIESNGRRDTANTVESIIAP